MKWIIALIIALLVIGCQETVDMSNDQDSREPEPAEPADEFADIQTAEDDFKAMEETLELLP